jgi:hypothetical protein
MNKEILKSINVAVVFGIFICPIWLNEPWMWGISWLIALIANEELQS